MSTLLTLSFQWSRQRFIIYRSDLKSLPDTSGFKVSIGNDVSGWESPERKDKNLHVLRSGHCRRTWGSVDVVGVSIQTG